MTRSSDLDIALKVLRPDLGTDQQWIERFRRELVLARQVTHRNVVRIHDIGESDGLRFLTMRYVEGRSLLDGPGTGRAAAPRARPPDRPADRRGPPGRP